MYWGIPFVHGVDEAHPAPHGNVTMSPIALVVLIISVILFILAIDRRFGWKGLPISWGWWCVHHTAMLLKLLCTTSMGIIAALWTAWRQRSLQSHCTESSQTSSSYAGTRELRTNSHQGVGEKKCEANRYQPDEAYEDASAIMSRLET